MLEYSGILRHVILPKPLLKMIPKSFFSPQQQGVLRLLSEEEWRCIGITQSVGWEHYEIHGESPRAGQSTSTNDYRIQLLNLTYSCSGDSRTETGAIPPHPDSISLQAKHSRFIQYYCVPSF